MNTSTVNRTIVMAAAAALAVLFNTTASLASTLYSYTGNDFTYATAPYTLSDSISGSFTTPAPLGANLDYVTITPTAFSFADGQQVINQNTSGVNSTFIITTNAAGAIDGWTVVLSSAGYINGIYTANDVQDGVFDQGYLFFGLNGVGNNTNPGTWVASPLNPVPLPGALPLFVSGFGAIGLMARRRKPQSGSAT